MENRGKYNPKIVFPSFSFVVNRYILHRPVCRPILSKNSRLVWINVPEYNSEPVSTQAQRVTGWAMVRTLLFRRLSSVQVLLYTIRLLLITGMKVPRRVLVPADWR